MYGSFGYRRLRTKVVEKVKLQRLKDCSKLSLGDLKKVKAYCELYHSEDEERLETIQRLEEDRNKYERKSRIHDDLSKTLDAEIKTIDSESYSLFCQAAKFEQGFFSHLLISREKVRISYILPSGQTSNRMIVKTPERWHLKPNSMKKTKIALMLGRNERSFNPTAQCLPLVAMPVISLIFARTPRHSQYMEHE